MKTHPLKTVILIVAVLLGSWASGQAQTATHYPPPPVDIPVVEVVHNEKQEIQAFQEKARNALLAGSYGALEEQAAELRKTKSRFSNSGSKLRAFYAGFGDFPVEASDEEWQAFIAAAVKWAEQEKDKATGLIALSEIYSGYAWKARSSKWASGVTQEGWKLMRERVKQSIEALMAAKERPEKCPGWYGTAVRLALRAQMPRAQYDALCEEGNREAGDYDALYAVRAYYLLPRWYGTPEEWERDAMATMRRKDVPDATEVFAKAAIYLNGMNFLPKEFSASDESWAVLKESFTALEAHYPKSLEIQSVFLRAAGLAYDYVEARKQLALMGNRYDPSCWDSMGEYQQLVRLCRLPDEQIERIKKLHRGR